jgi:hypothetical protein
MTEQFRRVTSTEFAAIVSRQIDLVGWLSACAFMQAAYGKQAYRLEAEVEENGYYDDENYSDCFSRLVVTDQAGNELKPDTTLSYWKEVIAPESEYRRYSDSDEEAAQQRLFDHEEPPIAMKSATYVIDQPPGEIPEVYVRVEDAQEGAL